MNVKLTKRTAWELISRICPRLNISKDTTPPDVAIFRASTGPAGLEIRRTLHIKEGDPLEIFTGEGGVTFRKYNPTHDVKGFLNGLKEVLQEDSDMKRKPEMMEKVKELEALLKAEQADFDKGE